MSALARFFNQHGVKVSGYDRTSTPLTDQLTREGMDIHFEDDIHRIPETPDLIIYTPAIPKDHGEYNHLLGQKIPMMKRAEVLGLISRQYKTLAVAGTHGKTTTSTIIAHLLRYSKIPHLAFLGGISKNYQTNFFQSEGLALPETKTEVHPLETKIVEAKDGDHQQPVYCVVEADEYDKSFLQLTPFIAVITSADADHLEIYGDHDDLRRTFSAFTGKISSGGSLIMKRGTAVTPQFAHPVSGYSYSLTGDSTFYPTNIKVEQGQLQFDLVTPTGTIPNITLGVPGWFNLENAVAALAVGYLLGIDKHDLQHALGSYQGVMRRFDFRIQQKDLVYIDDYAHHPEEIRASVTAAREIYPGRRITGIFQPHLFTRTRDLADDFARSLDLLDEVWLLDIYPAREKPIPGVTSQMLLDRMKQESKRVVSKAEVVELLKIHKPEVLLTLGAGDIDKLVDPITQVLQGGEK